MLVENVLMNQLKLISIALCTFFWALTEVTCLSLLSMTSSF